MSKGDKYGINPKDLEIDYHFFDKILGSMDATKMNQFEIVKRMYDACYMFYGMKYIEERNMRLAYEKKVVEKVGIIDEKDAEIKFLEEACNAAGISIQRSGEEEVQEDTESVLLHEGSDGDKGDT